MPAAADGYALPAISVSAFFSRSLTIGKRCGGDTEKSRRADGCALARLWPCGGKVPKLPQGSRQALDHQLANQISLQISSHSETDSHVSGNGMGPA